MFSESWSSAPPSEPDWARFFDESDFFFGLELDSSFLEFSSAPGQDMGTDPLAGFAGIRTGAIGVFDGMFAVTGADGVNDLPPLATVLPPTIVAPPMEPPTILTDGAGFCSRG